MILLLAPCKTFRRQDLRVPACSTRAIVISIPFITLIAIVPMLVARQPTFGVVSWPIKSTGKARRGSLGFLLDSLSKMNTWLRFEGRGQLPACDRGPLQPGFAKLQMELNDAATELCKLLHDHPTRKFSNQESQPPWTQI